MEEVLPEAFAVVREASRRTLAMRHFDVQMIGGVVLHRGKISEMKTGEGKTLVAALALYLNGLTGLGSHLITVNDYLAGRDATWMGPIYKLLGLTTGVINHDSSFLVEWEEPELVEKVILNNHSAWPIEYADSTIPPERNLDIISSFKTVLKPSSRQQSYRADITYGTNNEFGFDYLRDNMKFSLKDYVQNGHNFAIVDEVDSILIDEARTPLIISGPSEDSTDLYYRVDTVVKGLKRDTDYTVDEKTRQVDLTEEGTSKVEKALNIENLYDPTQLKYLHHVNQSLKAHSLFKKDVDYMMQDKKVIIVDEFTGRLMPGRRWSDGLHQAVEAKEAATIESENQTLATITIQNYFRMYRKLAGMTGTADTEAAEFKSIYNLDVAVIPTNMPLARTDYNDAVYKSTHEKISAACEEIKKLNSEGIPVLVGTASIEQSEKVSSYLQKYKLPHQILNAKHHAKEAEIIAQAGRIGAITIATNMAGRGTDILLGGNPDFLARDIIRKKFKVDPNDADQEQYEDALFEARAVCDEEKNSVKKLGGLHIVGTERHESRRIDNQLRGRAGRQGDKGASKFYVSLEDDLMRIFASEKITGIMDKLGWKEGEPIEHSMISKSIENAQKKVESRNFDIRKHLLEYDDVLNTQRTVVYNKRREILEGGENLKEILFSTAKDLVADLVENGIPKKSERNDNDLKKFEESIKRIFNVDVNLQQSEKENKEDIGNYVNEQLLKYYQEKENEIGHEILRQVERYVMLQSIDYLWKDHLLNMDHLREGIGLRGYAQKDPLHEYKREGFDMFSAMMVRFDEEVCENLFKVRPVKELDVEDLERKIKLEEQKMVFGGPGEPKEEANKPVKRAEQKIGRNDTCPCGSGLKYKKCHGK
ncbi:MAG: preprotein translocase subunit SecA [Thermodesulfobacteriota bacterium]